MNARVLVAEDEPQIRQYVADILGTLPGVEAHFAPDGETALELLRKGGWNLVISDQRMGLTDGIVVLREAAKLVPGARRMMVTGYAELALLTDAKNGAHVHRFLSKPFSASEFARTVSELLDAARDDAQRRGAFERALGAADKRGVE